MKILVEPHRHAEYEYYCDNCRYQILDDYQTLTITPGYGSDLDMMNLVFCSNECISNFFSPAVRKPFQAPLGTKQLPKDHPHDELYDNFQVL